MSSSNIRVRLVFADEGSFHTETISVPAGVIEDYDRLIDMLREEPAVTRNLFVDLRRLVSASILDQDDD